MKIENANKKSFYLLDEYITICKMLEVIFNERNDCSFELTMYPSVNPCCIGLSFKEVKELLEKKKKEIEEKIKEL